MQHLFQVLVQVMINNHLTQDHKRGAEWDPGSVCAVKVIIS